MPNAAEYYARIAATENPIEGGLNRLTQSLVGIHERKRARARQAELDRIAAEREARAAQAAEDARQIQLFALKRELEAQRPSTPTARTFEQAQTAEVAPGKAPMMTPDTPEERAAFVPPTPGPSLTIGGETLQAPSAAEIQARQTEDFARSLVQKQQEQEALEPTIEIPGRGRIAIRALPGIAALERADQAAGGAPDTQNIGGRRMGWNPVTRRFDIDYGAAGKEGGTEGPTPTALLGAQMDIAKSFQRYTTDARTAQVQSGIVRNSLLEAKRAMAAGQGLGPASQAVITAFGRIIDPGSTVRESEYARTPEGLALLNRIEGFYLKMRQGGAGLTVADLEDVGRAADAFMSGYAQTQLNYAQLAKKQAEMIGRLSGGTLGDLSTILPPDALKLLETGDQPLPANKPTITGVRRVQ